MRPGALNHLARANGDKTMTIDEFVAQKIALWQWLGAAALFVAVSAMCGVAYYQIRVWQLELTIIQLKGELQDAYKYNGNAGKLHGRPGKKGTSDSPVGERHYQVWTMLDMDQGAERRRVSKDQPMVQGRAHSSICSSRIFRTAYWPRHCGGEGTGPYMR